MIERIRGTAPPPFAIVHRPHATGDHVDVLVGEVSTPDTLAEIALPDDGPPGHDVLVIVPYRQVVERGFAAVDDGAPLIAMRVTDQAILPRSEVLGQIPDEPIPLSGGHFDLDDDTYAEIVRRVITEEIAQGTGANFVLRRSFVAELPGYRPAAALTFFRRLCERELGAYWTFVVHTGDRTFVGATPERHVSLQDGVAVMNPISGTYRYPPSGPTLAGLMDFLHNTKENDELHMVVDEELKMMARVCAAGGRLTGPFLKEMRRLAHTEYLIKGKSTMDPRTILHETMFAPTVTGSPVESACRVISRYEPDGRGYYSGVIGLIGRDNAAQRHLDSAILIRTADVDGRGRMRIGVGATLVRHSDPDSEVAETHAKVAGLLSALDVGGPARFGERPEVVAALHRLNAPLAGFWLADTRLDAPPPSLAGRSVLVIDAEDTFTAMIAQQLTTLGLDVTVRRFDERYTAQGHDLVVMGPGPGDPRDTDDPRIAHLHTAIDALLDRRVPFLAVCLSHQVVSLKLGLPVSRCPAPNQGTRSEIDMFGEREVVGFYNSFAARSGTDVFHHHRAGRVEVSRDPGTGEVHALRAPHFATMQFHAESVLTKDGPRILATRIKEVLDNHASHDHLVGPERFGPDHRLIA
ncbi:anthranilate synthase family protein [Actinophytocola algeriensis]|uniref:anthranilate synthase n=1 Tax=Actinophytocola algeriensis TaxID=1768010 RepID=A0A7W7QFS2_9PSEU|nr:anthranilate synthase family protein [Actinophytocola algeriensis]MBB4912831.1 phenazine biosynthesis protein phzE [Actinophytocola algeriensis]MBE1474135.1 phenazine biosynthesis protein phzE [Actinophytocola algeriensis]